MENKKLEKEIKRLGEENCPKCGAVIGRIEDDILKCEKCNFEIKLESWVGNE
ncbi:hypothetical protein [Clostridium botulinum]|uniref:hypothetical protein n=1 Tax=Clostridium botulinum TaxID=1491 RepID=UPI00036E0FB8|nr:hypothetical protein [Clostridium botulinum]